jgi:8-oxo-dGTP pyrophosphatase MutT (NUDIX family)
MLGVPQHVVMVIPFDLSERMLQMYRGPNVRSAPNVWSFPSGMHDFGETMEDCARREMLEEYNLAIERLQQVGTLENVPGDGYHWVITLFVGLVEDVEQAVNREPEKHPRMRFPPVSHLLQRDFYLEFPFNPSVSDYIKANRSRIVHLMTELVIDL